MKVKIIYIFKAYIMLTNINSQWCLFIYFVMLFNMNCDLISHEELSLYYWFSCLKMKKKKDFHEFFLVNFLSFFLFLSYNVVGFVCVCVFAMLCYQYECNLIKWFLFIFPFVFSSSHIFIIYLLLSFHIIFVVVVVYVEKAFM